MKQSQKNVDIQFHASDFVRNSPFNDDLQMNSNKKIESPEMQTQDEIHNVSSNSKSQPLDIVSSQSFRCREMDTTVDVDLTAINSLKLHTHPSVNKQVIE